MAVKLLDWMQGIGGSAGSSGYSTYGAGGGGGAGGAGTFAAITVDPNGRVINNQAVGRGLRQNGMGVNVTPETKEQKVIRMLKGDFEKYIGMSYAEFEEIKNNLIENNPEKLI